MHHLEHDLQDIVPPVVLDAAALLGREFQPREQLLAPWLTSQSLAMVYARRGVGKTHFAFEVHFEKARALYGQDVDPIDAKLESLDDGTQTWTTKRVADAADDQILEMTELGLSTREIGSELGIAHSTVVRTLARLKESGRYTPKPKAPRKPRDPTTHWSDRDDR